MATWIDRTQTSGNRQIFTYSAWVKFTGDNLTSYAHLATTNPNPGNWDTIRLDNNRKFEIICNNNSNILRTSRVFRDTNAWYHFVVAVDTTQSTDTNRTKLYVNGVQETSFESTGYPPQNHNTNFNTNSQTFRIGHNTWSTGGGEYFTGLMSHVHWIDGTAYAPTVFGETDSTTGEWKIKTSPSVTYGTNGFFIFKDSQSITDQSGEGNNFTVGAGTLTKTEDNPSNVFATLNPLDNIASSTFSEGNNTVTTVNSNAACNTSTLGAISGKYYWEVKMTAGESNQESYIIGLVNASPNVSGYDGSIMALGFGLRGNGNINGIYGQTTGWNTFAVNDIINIAVDFDNGKAYFGTNGSWGNSSNPSTGTNGYSFTVGSEFWRMAVNCRETSKDGVFKCNFGNGYFGTTAVSSAGTNASGIGIFEYDVPSGGYTALSTKGLNL
jgi:hypothetical protein